MNVHYRLDHTGLYTKWYNTSFTWSGCGKQTYF